MLPTPADFVFHATKMVYHGRKGNLVVVLLLPSGSVSSRQREKGAAVPEGLLGGLEYVAERRWQCRLALQTFLRKADKKGDDDVFWLDTS